MNPLPNRPTLRVSEVAYYYGVSERCVYMWIEHGKLDTVHTPGGQKRITRDSLDACRLANPLKKSLNNFTS
jgi:excisionase family DNA binding protein